MKRSRARKSLVFQADLASGSRHRYRILVVAFHLLAAFWVSAAFFPAEGLTAENVLTSTLLLSAVLCFALQIVLGSAKRSGGFDRASKTLLYLFFAWCLVTVLRGVEPSTPRLLTLLANPTVGGLVWFLPFAVYIGRQPGVLEAVMPAFRLHAIFGIALLIWMIGDGSYNYHPSEASAAKVGLVLLYGAPVVLLTGIGGRLDRWVYMSGLATAVVANYLLSSRASFATTLIYLMIALGLGRARSMNRLTLRMIGLIAVATGLVLLGTDYVLSRLSDEWFIDTRTFLWVELNEDFSHIDWIFGRGALGTYYSPYFDYVNRAGLWGDWMIRQVNEIGYLHIILKAGLIGAVLYFLNIARAAYKSLFIDNKRFALGLALYLSIHLTELLVTGYTSFQPSRVLLWVVVGIALASSHDKRSSY